jgi:hypothetical protein
MSAQQSPGEPAPHVPVWMPGQFKRRISTVHAVQLGLAEYADDPWAAWRWHGRRIPDWFGDLSMERLWPEFHSEDYWYFLVRESSIDDGGDAARMGPDDWLCFKGDGNLRVRSDADFRARYLPYYAYSEAKP